VFCNLIVGQRSEDLSRPHLLDAIDHQGSRFLTAVDVDIGVPGKTELLDVVDFDRPIANEVRRQARAI
jgi:hypothetical protein